MSVSFGIFSPHEGCEIHEALAHMAGVAAVLEKTHNINVAILKSLDQSWFAVFAAGKEGSQNGDGSAMNLPEAAAFTRGLTCAVRMVESGWFRPTSNQSRKGVHSVQLSVGEMVSVRRIHTSWKRQEMLSYSYLAILRSYFNYFRGLLSYSFYDSLDGKQIMGLGVWESVETASAIAKHKSANPAIVYWRELGAKKLEYHVCQVVYATRTTDSMKVERPRKVEGTQTV